MRKSTHEVESEKSSHVVRVEFNRLTEMLLCQHDVLLTTLCVLDLETDNM